MKKVLMFSLFAALCCSSGYLSAQTMMTKQTRFEGQNITGVAAGTAFQVEIYQSDKTSATVELPAKWAEKLEFTIDNNGVVSIKLKGFKLNLKNEDELKATVYLKNPYSLQASSSATITAKTPIKTATLNIDINSSGKINIPDLTASNRVVINGSSSGDIEAKITAPLLRCDVNSSASADLEHLWNRSRTECSLIRRHRHQRKRKQSYSHSQFRRQNRRRGVHCKRGLMPC